MFADRNRIINFIILNYLTLIVFFNQCLCLEINEKNLINNNESSVIDQPMIHLNDQQFDHHSTMMDIVNNLTNYSNDNLKKLTKQSRSGISVVYSELNDKKDNTHSSFYLKDNNYDDQMNSQDYIYLEQPTNFIDNNSLKNNLPRKNLIYKAPSSHLIFESNDDYDDNSKCKNKSTNSPSLLNVNSQLESEISAEHFFLNTVNSSNFKKNFNDDKVNINLPNKLYFKNNPYNHDNNLTKLQHRSTDTIIYKTPINLENDYLDFKFMTRQPSKSQFISNRFIAPSKNQLTKSSSSSNFLSKKNNNPTSEIDFLKNKFINQNKFNRENDKKLDNQFKKRLNSEENYGDDDEFKFLNQNDNNQNDNELNNNQDLNYDFEFSKEFKNKENQFNKVNNNEMLDQIYTQIEEQNQSNNLNKLINQFLNKQKEFERNKKYSNYYLQYLQNQPPIKYIPLNHVKPIKKPRSHSKFKYHYHPLNLDRRSLASESYFNSPFMPIFNNPSTFSPPTPNWYYRKQKPKVDDNLYRKLIWLRKQSLINSILNTVNKQSFPSRRMNLHELQPDSSDDLYSYSTMADLDLNDYENDVTIPQGQSLSSVYDYPMMMGYPQPTYKYIPATPPQPIIMPAPMVNYYDPYRYSMPKYQPQDDYHKHTEHHHEHYAHLQPAPVSYVTRNAYKKPSSDLKDMLWPLLFAVVLPLTFGALLLPLTLMFLVNLFMLLQILRNPNNNDGGGDGGDGGPALAKINKYKSELLSMSPRTDLTNSTTIISNRNQRRLKRTINKSPFLNQKKINEIHLRLLKALIQVQKLFNQPNQSNQFK